MSKRWTNPTIPDAACGRPNPSCFEIPGTHCAEPAAAHAREALARGETRIPLRECPSPSQPPNVRSCYPVGMVSYMG